MSTRDGSYAFDIRLPGHLGQEFRLKHMFAPDELSFQTV